MMSTAGTNRVVRVEVVDEGSWWRVALDRAKGNVLDREMVSQLTDVFREAGRAQDLKAIILEGEGGHFSFGASVAEHRADVVGEMLPEFHELFRAMFAAHVFTVVAVRGQCLGGGLEVAMFGHRIFAHPDAKLGQPEIRLGVFAPVASVLLPERIGRAAAEELCLTGTIIDARRAECIGLVDELAENPENEALEYVRGHFTALSARSLRLAVRAARTASSERYDRAIAQLERLYLEELMATEDACEGIESFLEKRPPKWRNC